MLCLQLLKYLIAVIDFSYYKRWFSDISKQEWKYTSLVSAVYLIIVPFNPLPCEWSWMPVLKVDSKVLLLFCINFVRKSDLWMSKWIICILSGLFTLSTSSTDTEKKSKAGWSNQSGSSSSICRIEILFEKNKYRQPGWQSLTSIVYFNFKTWSTRGQRPNESQKAVIIDMMKSVGEIASEIWPVF